MISCNSLFFNSDICVNGGLMKALIVDTGYSERILKN